MTTDIPASVLVLKTRMRKLYLSWWITHYSVGFLGVIAGTLLTALTSAPDAVGGGESAAAISLAALKHYAWLIGIVAAVCTSLVTFLGPIHKAERYWSAYHLLDQACLEYEQGFLPLKKFLPRVKQARLILQAADPSDRTPADIQEELVKQ